MARNYTPKNIELIFEQIEATPEEVQQRLDDIFDVLFEETLKFLKNKNSQSTQSIQTFL